MQPLSATMGPVRRLGYVAAKRLVLEVLGWTLVVLGIAALFLPGPGLLMLFSGMVVLSGQYEWVRKRVDPVKRMALEGASHGVQSWPRVALSLLGVAGLIGAGLVWGMPPPVPSWWRWNPEWWFVGGWGTGVTLIFSGLVALALLIYSYRRFRGQPYDHSAERRRVARRHVERRRLRRQQRLAQAEQSGRTEQASKAGHSSTAGRAG